MVDEIVDELASVEREKEANKKKKIEEVKADVKKNNVLKD
jgi:hypothetical protein